MTWVGDDHGGQNERLADLVSCTFHEANMQCAEVPDLLDDVTEFIPWHCFCGVLSVAPRTLWILWINWRYCWLPTWVVTFCWLQLWTDSPVVPWVSKALISTTAQGLSAEVFYKVLPHLSSQFPLEKEKKQKLINSSVLIHSYHLLSCFKYGQIGKFEDPMMMIPCLSHFLQIKAEDLFNAICASILVLLL